MSIPLLDLSLAADPHRRAALLHDLREALFHVGFLYIVHHGVDPATVAGLTARLPALFDLPAADKDRLAKRHSPHFLGYSAFAAEVTQGRRDLREQFDLATELPAIHVADPSVPATDGQRDFSQAYWRLRGPNQWPDEAQVPGFREAFLKYHQELEALAYRFVHLVEEAFAIPVGTFDGFFHGRPGGPSSSERASFLPPQHRIKLIKYHPTTDPAAGGQGVGAHKDSSGWLTFLHQVDDEPGLEVLGADGTWIAATPVPGSFVVNFGNAFEAATAGAVRATIHRVRAPAARVRYSIPFFMGVPLDLTVSEIQSYIPDAVRSMRREAATAAASAEQTAIPSFLDPQWDHLGELQLRKWIRSHPDVAREWYPPEVVSYYLR